jgi:hypothetical protein
MVVLRLFYELSCHKFVNADSHTVFTKRSYEVRTARAMNQIPIGQGTIRTEESTQN